MSKMTCKWIGGLQWTGLVLVAVGLLMTPHTARAVHDDGLFEVDGNVADDATAGDDWVNVANGTSHAKATTDPPIVQDTTPAVFRGGSKDINDVSTWVFDLGSSPPKDNMLNAYAAAYAQPVTGGTELVIYAGADRDAFSGTASLGFWFFKNTVVRNNATGTFVDGSGNPAHHADGDVLVAFEYTNGGAVSNAAVYKWQSGALTGPIATGGIGATGPGGPFCNPADTICADGNAASLVLPWNGTVQAGQFFEMGINISQVVGGGSSCFSSFMATSRSAVTANAQLKNFILGAFPVCGITVGKTCTTSAVNSNGVSIHSKFSVPVKNTGFGAVSAVSIQEDFTFGTGESCAITAVTGAPAGDTFTFPIAFGSSSSKPSVQIASSLAGSATVTATVECDANATPMTNKIKASAKSSSGLTTPDLSASHLMTSSETCSLNITDGLALTKVCNGKVTLSGLSPVVCVDITVTNNSDEKLVSVSVTDDQLGTLATNATLAPKGATGSVLSFQKKCYTATAQDDPTNTDTSLATFSDTVNASGTGAITGSAVTATAAKATCSLCPTCTTCAPATP